MTKAGWHVGADRGDPHHEQQKEHALFPEDGDGQQEAELDQDYDPFPQEQPVQTLRVDIQSNQADAAQDGEP